MGDLTRPDVIDLLGPLRRYARALTRDESQAEDLVHDALVRALERQHTLRPSSNLRTWLMTVLHNVFIDGQRRRRTEARYAGDLAREHDQAAPAAQEHSLRLAQVRRAFDGLPDEQRAAIHLVTIDGLAYQEAADVLGIPIGTLMSRLGRARAALRSLEDAPPAALRQPEPVSRPQLRIVGGVEAGDPDTIQDRARAGARNGGRRD